MLRQKAALFTNYGLARLGLSYKYLQVVSVVLLPAAAPFKAYPPQCILYFSLSSRSHKVPWSKRFCVLTW